LFFALVFRNGKVKDRPWAFIRCSPYPSAMILKDGTAY
jgi:hypothetical protein